jgi:hypothetical protein
MLVQSRSREKGKRMNIKDIRRAGVPLFAIESQDPAATMKAALAAVNGKAESIPIAQWDMTNGLRGVNSAGETAISWYDPLAMNLPEILKGLQGMPQDSIVFMHNLNRFWERDGVAQGVWCLRDAFKASHCTLVLLGANAKLPAELQSDVVVSTEPPPSREEVDGIVTKILASAGKAGAKVEQTDRGAVSGALLGLGSAFDVEQTLSLSIGKSGVDVPSCWERKIKRLKATTGAEITINNPTFKDLAGCANVKSEISGFINGRQKPGVVLFMDEIEKLFAGAGTDLSGVSTNLVGMFLTWTAERKAKGFLLPGVPGAGKTWTATCTAGEAKVPLFKLADMKASLVGESEGKLRSALAAVDALAGDGSVLMVASCNWVDNISPDIMARFTMGQFFYDFPTTEERGALWKLFMRKLELPDQEIPSSDGWVGREIESCCWRAWQYQRPLVEVARNICPSSISQKTKLEALRKACSGRFLSAATPGLYQAREISTPLPASGDRVLKFD